MTTITTRATKGSPLSWAEADANFTNLNTDKLEVSSNLSDLASASTARTNLGLGNVDNTSDINKPVSTAQQTAINSSITTHVAGSDPHTQYLQESVAAAPSGSSLIGYTRGVTGATTRTVESVLYETVSVKDFGAVGDGIADDTAAFNLAIAYANSKGGNDRALVKGTTIHVPTGQYRITSPLNTITVSHVSFKGDSRDSAALFIETTGNVFHFGGGTTIGAVIAGGGINNLKIEYRVLPTNSSVLVYVDYAFSIQIYDLVLIQIGNLVTIGRDLTYQGGEVYVENVNGSIMNSGVPLINLLYGSGFFMSKSHVFVFNVQIPNHPDAMTVVNGTDIVRASAGLLWDTAQFSMCAFERFDRGIVVSATTGAIYETFKFTNVIMDYLKRECVYLDSNGGGVVSGFEFDSTCWFLSWQSDTVLVTGVSGVNDRHTFSGVFILSGGSAVNYYVPSAKNITFTHMRVSGCNRQGTALGAMYFASGSKGFNISNVQCNGIPSYPFPVYQAAYGLTIGADCDNYIVTGCSFEGTTLGYSVVANITMSANRKVFNNIHADYATSAAVVVPGSGTLYQNKTPFVEEYSLYGGTTTVYSKNGVQIGTTGPCTFTLQPSEYYFVTYTVVPTGLKTIQR